MEVVLFNPTEADIAEYPISEYQLDNKGNPLIDRNTQKPIDTGVTYTWSLAAGKKARFPKYVSDILRDRFEFLEVSVEELNEEDPLPVFENDEPLKEGELRCKYCGRVFSNARALGMHLGAMHPEKLA